MLVTRLGLSSLRVRNWGGVLVSDDHLRREVKTRKHSVFKFFYLEAWSNGLSSKILSGWNDWDTLEHE